MSTSVRDVMRPAVTVAATSSAADALSLLLETREDSLYVTDIDGRLIGVLPDYEVLKSVLAGTHHQQAVGGLLSTNVQTIAADSLVYQVAARFRAWQTQTLAVVEDDRIVGRIGRNEILLTLCSTPVNDSIRTDDFQTVDADSDRSAVRPPKFARRTDDRRQRLPQESM